MKGAQKAMRGFRRWRLAVLPVTIAIAASSITGQVGAAAATPRAVALKPALPVDGCFGAKLITSTSNGGGELAAGEFDGDSKLDVVVLGPTLGMMQGNGDGTFTNKGETAIPDSAKTLNGTGRIVVGDFNHDGKLDVAVAAGSSVAVFLGNGDGTFGTAQNPYLTTAVPNGAVSITAGEFDGDGNLDIAALSNDRVSILKGNGDGSFTVQPTTYPVHQYSNQIKAGDLNGDGKTDLAAVSTQHYVSILLGDGAGGFPTEREFSAGGGGYHLAIGDVNGDGRNDIVTDGPTGPGISVLLNQGNDANGIPSFVTTGYGSGIYSSGVVLADVNNDGNLDALVGGPFRSALLGNGDGTFQSPAPLTNFVVGQTVYDINVADVNGDGRVDVVLAAPQGVEVQLNKGCPTASLKAVSTQQYTLTGSDGMTWSDMDTTSPTPLILTVTPTVDSQAIVSGNADLWTDTAGYNQDIGITASGGSGTGTIYPTVAGQPEAWKESGGFAGTFSPNAAYLQTVLHFKAGQPYTVKLQWKSNKQSELVPTPTPHMPAIYAAAGPIPAGAATYSPTRLKVELVPDDSASVVSASATSQFTFPASDGATWTDLGPGVDPSLSFRAPANGIAILTGNADLWTGVNGYNQDIGITVSGGSGSGTTYPTAIGQPEAWKESGGFAGTFSPNAAFVQAVLQLADGQTYQARLQWKANKQNMEPANNPSRIFAGAGPIPKDSTNYSPTRLTLLFVPESANSTVIDKSRTAQDGLALSDGSTWQPVDGIGSGGQFVAHFVPPGNCLAVISGNADLWTNTAGYNQDIGIAISGGDYPANPAQPVAWKESGGFAGTFSPNAAFVQTVIPVKSGIAYEAWLVWKTNKQTVWAGPPAAQPTIYSGAGPIGTEYSPTRITVQLTGCP